MLCFWILSLVLFSRSSFSDVGQGHNKWAINSQMKSSNNLCWTPSDMKLKTFYVKWASCATCNSNDVNWSWNRFSKTYLRWLWWLLWMDKHIHEILSLECKNIGKLPEIEIIFALVSDSNSSHNTAHRSLTINEGTLWGLAKWSKLCLSSWQGLLTILHGHPTKACTPCRTIFKQSPSVHKDNINIYWPLTGSNLYWHERLSMWHEDILQHWLYYTLKISKL